MNTGSGRTVSRTTVGYVVTSITDAVEKQKLTTVNVDEASNTVSQCQKNENPVA